MPAAMPSIRSLTLAPAVLGLAACVALPQPFSQIDGHRYHLAPIDTYAVQLVRIDDRDTLDDPVFVEPGLRRVTVQGPGGIHRFGEQRVIELNVAPCTRYHLVAVKTTRLATDFSVRVDQQEPIGGGCRGAPASK